MFKQLKIYINNRITLAKFDLVDSLSGLLAGGIYVLILSVFVLFLLLLGSLALGFILGEYFDNVGLGFLSITGMYFLIVLLFLLFKKKIKLLLINMAVENAMNSMNSKSSRDYE